MQEILAPVGGKEQLLAAVRAGVDAVYLGAKNFNARRSAANFDDAELYDAVAYCHARNVKVHVTLNTLVMDSEIPALLDEIKYIAESGADAVIVQDLAVAKLVKEHCPTLAMHASTQMTVHNLAGVLAAKELGFSRVVLSRELSYEEICAIAAETDVELEVFVHGALCMCMSGACYLSSMLGGRSGNRGLCAQPCRLDFRYGNKEYALSLKDMSYVEHMEKLAKAGVCSFKIEGRMKRPEYVAAAVTACKAALAGEKPDMETLRAVFSRQGFTDGYFTGKRGADMFGFRSHEDVTAGEKVFKSLATVYKDETPRVPLTMTLSAAEGTAPVLSVSDGENTVLAEGTPCQKAIKAPTEYEHAFRYLSKTGGTPFYLKSLDFSSDGECIIPAGEMNEMRRFALGKLLDIRSRIKPKEFISSPLSDVEKHTASEVEIRIRAEKYDQVCFEHSATVILPLKELELHPEAAERFSGRIFAELPPLVFPKDEEKIRKRLSALVELGISDAVCDNIGTLKIAKEAGMTVHGGYGLNILNSVALSEYERLGLVDATVSFELSAGKLRRLGGKIPHGIIGYGYLPLMKTRACPLKKPDGCQKCTGTGKLRDRKGKEFTYLCFERKFGTLLNSLPLWIADREIQGADFMTLWFTTESRERCKKVYDLFIRHEAFDSERTAGLYFRELL